MSKSKKKKAAAKRKKSERKNHPIISHSLQVDTNSSSFIKSSIPDDVKEIEAPYYPYDENLLDRARTQWQFGDWQSLSEIERDTLQHHPDRAKLAMLAAAGHQQLGDMNMARHLTRCALEWGCSPRMVAQVLIAGVHNTLGCAAALKQDENRTAKHFEAALAVVGNKETAMISYARSVREMGRMGLLPQGASLVDKKIKDLKNNLPRSVGQQAHLKILATELELLRHELSLAQQRQQLFQPVNREEIPSPDPSNLQWSEMLKKKAVSQLGQDLWVLEKTNYKRDGFFVEFGATDGVLLSNTWLLEKEFGWNGICAEPNPGLFDRLKKNRHCTISNACLGEKTGERVEFIFADAFGGMTKHAHGDKHGGKRQAYKTVGETTVLTTISLHDFLLQHQAPKTIDYLSIDTEGSEFDILRLFPFDQWNVRFLTIEHNYTKQRVKIRELLEAHGFVCEEAQWDDWYYKPVLRETSKGNF